MTQIPKDQEKSLAMTSLLKQFLQQKVIIPVPQEEEGLGCSHVVLVKKPSKVPVDTEFEVLEQVHSIQKYFG